MELYIKSINDPNFDKSQLQVDDPIAMLMSQIETLLFTNRGEVLGNPGFGLNLEDYVYSFRYNDDMIKGAVTTAITDHIPMASRYPVTVDVEFTEETERNIVFVNITIANKYGIGIYI